MFKQEPSQVGGFGENMGLEAMGKGTVILKAQVEGKSILTTLHDMIYVPKATNCLLAIRRIDSKGGLTNFSDKKVTIQQPDGQVRIVRKLIRQVYLLEAHAQTQNNTTKIAVETQGILWLELHHCYGHALIHSLQQMITNKMVDGLKVDTNSNSSFQCQACVVAKISRTPFPKYGVMQAIDVGDITHSDLWGPARIKSIGKNLYYMALINDYS